MSLLEPARAPLPVPRLIGMVHLGPLPGAPRFAGSFQAVLDAALRDAEALIAGGMPALMVENFGDVPFYPGPVPVYTVTHLTAIACALRQRFAVPLGINVLRNDGAAVIDISASYRMQPGVEFFVTGQNIGNRTYVASGSTGASTPPGLAQPIFFLVGVRLGI